MSSHFQVLRSTAAFPETYTSNLETVDEGLGDLEEHLYGMGKTQGLVPGVGVG